MLSAWQRAPGQPKPYWRFESPLSATTSQTNVLRSPPNAYEGQCPRTFGRKPPHCERRAEARNSLSCPVCLQTSRLLGFSMELVSACF